MSDIWINAAAGLVKTNSAAGLLTEKELLLDLEGEGTKDTALLIAASPEIGLATGAQGEYFFDKREMSDSYARTMVRVEEKDYIQLLSDTVERESRVYPRTTAVERFLEEPFSVPPEHLPHIVEKLLAGKENRFASCRASNGAVHLFSPVHLDRAQAQYLAEWEEVGSLESQ